MTFILPSFGASAIAAVPGGGGGFANDYSLSFDGTNDYGDAGVVSALQNASAFSFSVWFKKGAASEFPAFGGFSSGTDQVSAHGYSNDLWFNVRNGPETRYVVPSSNLPTDTTNFHHYVYTFDGGTFKVYVDGTERSGTKSNSGTTSSGTANFNFKIGYQGYHYDQGLYDEFAIFTSALSSSDVTAIYNGGNGPTDISSLSPKHWWRMGDSDTGVSNGSSTPTIVSNVGNSSAIQNHYALDFDGSNDYLSLGNLGTAGRSLGSMLFWVNITSTNGIHSANLAKFLVGFGGAGGGFYWGYWGTNTDLLTLALHSFNRRTRFNAPSAGDKLTAGWHLIGVNHNGTSYDIIIDGVTAPNATLNSGSTGSYSIQNATSIISGTDFDDVKVMTNTAGSYASEGLVDEFAIWDSALSSSDITAIYNSGVPADIGSGGLNLNPTGWWRMGDGGTWNGSNWSIPDASANSNTGTTANMVEADRATDTPTANAILKNGPTYSDNVPT